MNKWEKRDKKRYKAQYGHSVDGKSVFLIQQELGKRAKKENNNG